MGKRSLPVSRKTRKPCTGKLRLPMAPTFPQQKLSSLPRLGGGEIQIVVCTNRPTPGCFSTSTPTRMIRFRSAAATIANNSSVSGASPPG